MTRHLLVILDLSTGSERVVAAATGRAWRGAVRRRCIAYEERRA